MPISAEHSQVYPGVSSFFILTSVSQKVQTFLAPSLFNWYKVKPFPPFPICKSRTQEPIFQIPQAHQRDSPPWQVSYFFHFCNWVYGLELDLQSFCCCWFFQGWFQTQLWWWWVSWECFTWQLSFHHHRHLLCLTILLQPHQESGLLMGGIWLTEKVGFPRTDQSSRSS